MFLEYWMIAAFVIVAGIWSERRYMLGVRSGINHTVAILAEQNLLKIDEQGHMVPHK